MPDDNANTDPEATSDTLPEPVSRRTGPMVAQRYDSRELIGRGGMGEVVTAHDKHIGRDVALKRMRGGPGSEREMQRFVREATIQGRLDHPAIVPVYDLDRDAAGVPFFVMKKLTGVTLAEVLRSPDLVQKYPRQRLLRALVEVCLAVELAHTRGIVHRDLKPGNLVLGDFGEVYVLDWGVAKVIGEQAGDFTDVTTPGDETQSGSIIGTPGYMAPEQILGVPDLDGRADVYSLGCVLFEVLAGAPLHPPGRAALDTTLAGDAARPSERAPDAAIPPELDALCASAIAADRDERLPTARQLGERIQRFLDGDRDLALRRQLARGYLARAREAFALKDDEPNRAIAMRDAGRALGLDPTLAGAADLVGRLMLEPPRTLPRPVETAIVEDDREINRSQARLGVWLYFGYFGFAPFLFGYDSIFYLIAYLGLVAVNLALMLRLAWGKIRILWLDSTFMLVLGNAALVAAISRVFSPIFLAPAVAGLTISGLVNTPHYARSRTVVGLVLAMLAAIFIPWIAESAGVISRTFEITDAGPVLYHSHLFGNAAFRTAGLVAFVVAMVGAGAAITYFVRRNDRATRRLLHLQAWHLRQLVPSAKSLHE